MQVLLMTVHAVPQQPERAAGPAAPRLSALSCHPLLAPARSKPWVTPEVTSDLGTDPLLDLRGGSWQTMIQLLKQ